MNQAIQYLAKQHYKVTHWSGGKTAEICLFPTDGKYQEGEFDYRVSSATIALDKTVFSRLSNYHRIIMSLTEPIVLYHEKETIELIPFKVHRFNGAIETRSVGQCIDFNLIYTPEYHGEMTVYYSGDEISIVKNRHYIIYALKQVQCYDSNKEMIHIHSGDSIQFLANANEQWKMVSQDNLGCIIVVEVYKLYS